MSSTLAPLTLTAAFTSWRADLTLLPVVAIALIYSWGARRAGIGWRPAGAFAAGVVLWVVGACSFVGVYADTLFWVRSLQFVVVLLAVPFCLALGRPVSVLRRALGPDRASLVDDALALRAVRVLASPMVTSAGVVLMPWLIYLTGWYPLVLRSDAIDVLTRILLVLCGFGYFYARLQLDPVPRRYPQGLSLLITLAETLGDGVLGVVMWQGPLIAATYYEALHRTWGPSLRTDQTIGAGVFWILGDLIGLPFLLVLFHRFRLDERDRADAVDAVLDLADDGEDTPVASTGLWWQADPQLQRRWR
ncbi:cytochrome c oxidase assembly protein [Gordonia sp. NPDC003504]